MITGYCLLLVIGCYQWFCFSECLVINLLSFVSHQHSFTMNCLFTNMISLDWLALRRCVTKNQISSYIITAGPGWQVLMQHLDGLEEVQQNHEFEMANLLAVAWRPAAWPRR